MSMNCENTKQCGQCINKYTSNSDRTFCEMFDYEYEQINATNALKILINPNFTDSEKHNVLTTLRSLGYDINQIYKSGVPPSLSVARSINVID